MMNHAGRCRALVPGTLAALALLATSPVTSAAQSDPSERPDILTLLSMENVESTVTSLGDDFLAHFLMLVPDLPAEDQAVLRGAVQQAFAPDTVRADLARSLASSTSADDTEPLLTSYASGALGELREVVTGFQPEQSVQEFGADMAALDPDRLRLMVSLVEARRTSELALSVDEALQRLAYQMVSALGGDPGPFTPLTDEQLQASYRNQTVRLGIESMHRLQPAETDLVQAAVDIHTGAEAQAFSEQYIEAVVGAIGQAGQDLSTLIAAGAPDEEAVDPLAGVTTVNPADAPPCFVLPCGFRVEWRGAEPTGGTQGYGSPGDFEDYTYAALVRAGYRLLKGSNGEGDGLTIRLSPSARTINCEIVVGTSSIRCLAVGEVRVQLLGTYPGFDGTRSFVVQNRCRSNQVMGAEGIANLVAARVHYALTTFEGDERQRPGC